METVSHCPNVSDYIRKASDKCAKVCGSYIQNGDCAYHWCVIPQKRAWWNFVPNLRSFSVRFNKANRIHRPIKNYTLLNPHVCSFMSNYAWYTFAFLLPIWMKDFCPEYDPIGQRFQKDIFTLCNPSTPIQRHYNSSDIFFCK